LTDQHSEPTPQPPERPSPLTAEPYGVVLDAFEGPLDLLLFLIRKSEVDIYDIPVATITKQYLAVLGQIHLMDLEGASDFVLMAATLMKIKSQMLLPREVMPEVEEGQGDPRQELVRRLLEYQQFKEVAEWLCVQGLEQREIFARGRTPEESVDGETVLHQINLFDLLRVYKHVLDNVPSSFVHRIVEEQITIEACIELVLSELGRRSRLRFLDLVSGQTREAMVATFVSILELLKSQRIVVQQARPFDEIWIESRSEESGDVGVRTDLTDRAQAPVPPAGSKAENESVAGGGAPAEDDTDGSGR